METEQLEAVVEELVESRMADIQLAIDDIGWKPLGVDSLEGDELSKEAIEDASDLLRATLVVNPLIKRGIAVRTSYIWGKGVKFSGVEETNGVFTNPLNKRFLFSSEALAENERCLATDGNFFVLAKGSIGQRRVAGREEPTAIRIPFKQITAHYCNPENPEEVWFYRREWEEKVTKADGSVKVTARKAWLPSDLYKVPKGKRRPSTVAGVRIDWSGALIDHCVNRQVGWRWGTPDAMAVIFWAKAHKEFLEDQARLVKAYSRFAFKATAPTPKAVKAVAAKVGSNTGNAVPHAAREDIGGTAIVAPGGNLQAIGRTSGSVDFSTGLPLASYVAAGLEVPLTDLLSDSSLSNRSAAETLTASKLAAMVERQKSWGTFFERLFAFWGKEVTVHFEEIEGDTTYRAIQAVTQAVSLNVLHAEEVRELIVKLLNLDSDKGLPTEEELGLLILAQKKAEEQAKAQPDYADPSYSDNSNRDDLKGGQHEYTANNENPT